jgi:hypothetical protein
VIQPSGGVVAQINFEPHRNVPAPEPREPLQANPTDPILSRRANPGLILPIHGVAAHHAVGLDRVMVDSAEG